MGFRVEQLGGRHDFLVVDLGHGLCSVGNTHLDGVKPGVLKVGSVEGDLGRRFRVSVSWRSGLKIRGLGAGVQGQDSGLWVLRSLRVLRVLRVLGV